MNQKVAYVGSSGSGKEGIIMEIRRIENEAQSQYILEPTKWLPVMAALHSGELKRVEVPIVKPEVHGTLLEKLDLGLLLSDKEHDELKNTGMNLDIHSDGHEDALRATVVESNRNLRAREAKIRQKIMRTMDCGARSCKTLLTSSQPKATRT